MINIVVLLEIKDNEALAAFETKAMEIMLKYGGRLLHAFRPSEEHSSPGFGANYEVHCLQFPNLEVFKQYRKDPTLTSMAPLRQKAIASTQLLVEATKEE